MTLLTQTVPAEPEASVEVQSADLPNVDLPDDETSWGAYRQLLSRLVEAPLTRRALSWAVHVGVALVALLLRLINLGQPSSLVFDENYYVKQAWSLSQWGVELKVDQSLTDAGGSKFASGDPNIFASVGDFVVHPPLAKWLIALGQMAGGVENPWSWRISAAIAGALTVLVLARLMRRLTGSLVWSTFAAGLLAVEGTSFVESRTGILDNFLTLFCVAAVAALLVDRDRAREQLAWRMSKHPRGASTPWLGWRPWRWVAGLMLGAALATKLSAIFLIAALALLTVSWDLMARRTASAQRWVLDTARLDAPFAFAQIVGTSAVSYLASWAGWFISPLSYGRDPNNLFGSWLKYQFEMLRNAASITSPQSWESGAWTWMLQLRPTLFYQAQIPAGQGGCPPTAAGGSCISMVTSLGTAPLWWCGILAVVGCAALVAWKFDFKAMALLVPFCALYLPWFAFNERTIYAFYTVSFAPFVVACVVYLLFSLSTQGVRTEAVITFVSVLLAVVSAVWFVWMYPVYTGAVIEVASRDARLPFLSWR